MNVQENAQSSSSADLCKVLFGPHDHLGLLVERIWESSLQGLVGHTVRDRREPYPTSSSLSKQTAKNLQRHTKLRRASQNTGETTLEESAEAFLCWNLAKGVHETLVVRLSFSCLSLQACLDDVGGGGEVGRRHACNGCGKEGLAVAEDLAVFAFAKVVFFQMIVGCEVNGLC